MLGKEKMDALFFLLPVKQLLHGGQKSPLSTGFTI